MKLALWFCGYDCIKYSLCSTFPCATLYIEQSSLTYDLTGSVCGRGKNALCTALLPCCSTARTLEYIVKSGFLSLIHFRVLSVCRLQQSFHWAIRPQVSGMLVDKDLEEKCLDYNHKEAMNIVTCRLPPDSTGRLADGRSRARHTCRSTPDLSLDRCHAYSWAYTATALGLCSTNQETIYSALAEYCDDPVCLSVCLRSHLRNCKSDLHQIFMHVMIDRGSVLLW